MTLPILWSFRRCPYAMRARLAIKSAGIPIEHREILLRDKPSAFLATSPKGTVPVVVTENSVIDESLAVMLWALTQNDPEHWLDVPTSAYDLIGECDGPFKSTLDRYKYASRHPDVTPETERLEARDFLMELDAMLGGQDFLYGPNATIADMAILTFIRQFAHVDLDWFQTQPWAQVTRWLADFKSSGRFQAIMGKHALWPEDATAAHDKRRQI